MAVPLRFGNFFICRGPLTTGAGAEPIVNNDPPEEVDGAKAMGELKGEDGCCDADWPNPPPVPNDDWGNVKFAPAAGEAGCDPKANVPAAGGAGAPNAKEEGWLNVDGLLGVEFDAGWPKGFGFVAPLKEKAGVGDVVDVGVATKEKAPVVEGLWTSSGDFTC